MRKTLFLRMLRAHALRPSRGKASLLLAAAALAACRTAGTHVGEGRRGTFSASAAVKVLLAPLLVKGGEAALGPREEDLVAAEIEQDVAHSEVITTQELFAARPDEQAEATFLGGDTVKGLVAAGKKVGADWVVSGWVGRGGFAVKDPSGPHLCGLAAIEVATGKVGRRAGCAEKHGGSQLDASVRRAAATLLQPDPPVTGPPSTGDLARLVNARAGAFEHCYAEALLRAPRLEGRALLQIAISNAGKATSAKLEGSTFGNPALEACVVEQALGFPYPKGVEATLSYPLVLIPAD